MKGWRGKRVERKRGGRYVVHVEGIHMQPAYSPPRACSTDGLLGGTKWRSNISHDN